MLWNGESVTWRSVLREVFKTEIYEGGLMTSFGVVRTHPANAVDQRRRVVHRLLFVASICVTTWLASASPSIAMPLLAGSVVGPSGKLEGVLVRATDVTSGSAVSVFSRAGGTYTFPDNALKPGAYEVDIRAAGYELGAPVRVEVVGGATRTLPIQLSAVKDPSTQWTNGDWIDALPPYVDHGIDQRFAMNMCTHCHSIEKVLRAPYDASILEMTIARMSGYAAASVPSRLVLRPDAATHKVSTTDTNEIPHDELALLFRGSVVEKMAKYIAGVNLSSGRAEFPFKPKTPLLPRGEATKVVIRSWPLPRKEAMPHDVEVDANGIAWYTDFGAAVLGRLNPATGEIKEYNLPILKPDRPKGSLDVRVTADGAVWVAMMYQGGVVRFDPKTEKFKTWSIPDANSPGVVQTPQLAVQYANVDGKIWIADANVGGVHRLDLHTGAVETFRLYEHAPPTKGTGFQHVAYAIASDSKNNLYFTDWGDSQIGRIDARTGKITFYQTTITPSRPRRGYMDSQDRYWFAEWQGNAVAVLDTHTDKIKEWKLPTANSNPYDAMPDAFGNVWAAGMANDLVQRVNTHTGKVTDYLLPEHNVNTRRVWVQNTKTGPVFWVGNNLGASIIAVQPLN